MLARPTVMSSPPLADSLARPYEVAIVGNDAVLAALPAGPMQLAHAILACGYDLVVPVSWGEEVVAEYVLRALAARGGAPAIFCACPTLRARLLATGDELAPFLISAVAPSVATARYLRALQPEVALRITLIGGCPEGRDPSIDTRVAPRDFLHLLANRGISLERQPAVFDSIVPPDRRRHYSLPGGCPAPKILERSSPERRLVTITDDAFSSELAEHLLGNENVLIDLTPRLGCACCGGSADIRHRGPAGRDEILRCEPPRSPTPILDHDIAISLESTVPVASFVHEPEPPVRLAPREPAPREFAQRESAQREPVRREPAQREPAQREAAQRAPAEQERAHATAARTTAMERATKPGAIPIGAARSKGEKRHIAVTPAGAMAAVPVRPRASGYWEPSRLPGVPSVARGGGGSALPARAAPGWHDVGATREAQRSEQLTAGGLGVVPNVPAVRASAPPVPVTPAASTARAPSPPPAVPIPVAVEPTAVPPARSSAVAAPPEMQPSGAAEGEAPPIAGATQGPSRRRPVPRVFQLSRAATHPRANAGGGKVLPRAYIGRRSTPTASRAIAPEEHPPISDVQRPLDVSVEPMATTALRAVAPMVAREEEPQPQAAASTVVPGVADAAPSTAEELDALSAKAVEGVSLAIEPSPTPEAAVALTEVLPDRSPVPDVAAEVLAMDVIVEVTAAAEGADADLNEPVVTTSPIQETELLETEVIAAESQPPSASDTASDAADVVVSSPSDVAEDWDVVARERAAAVAARSDAISADVLARIRLQAQRPGRVVAREFPPPREPREPGRILVVLTTAVLVLALIVAFAVIFRRAPTAPW